MTPSSKLIITETEALREIGQDKPKSAVSLLGLIEGATLEIERYLGKDLVTRGTVTEFHEFKRRESELQVKHWPIISLVSVHEDDSLVYDAASLLTQDTHFRLNKSRGILVRLSGTSKSSWLNGYERVRDVYTGGYATQDDVPQNIKKVCAELVAMQYREIADKRQNEESITDSFGTVRRFGPPCLTRKMMERLGDDRNWPVGESTLVREELVAA